MIIEEFDMPITKVGNSVYVLLTQDVRNFLSISDKDSQVRGAKDMSKHGKFVGMWNPKQQRKDLKANENEPDLHTKE